MPSGTAITQLNQTFIVHKAIIINIRHLPLFGTLIYSTRITTNESMPQIPHYKFNDASTLKEKNRMFCVSICWPLAGYMTY